MPVLPGILLAGLLLQQTPQPPPGPDTLTGVEKTIRDQFKADYAKKTPRDKAALAAKLVQQASQTKDDLSSQFVLYREAQDLYAQAADVEAAFGAIDACARVFAINTSEWKSRAVETAAKAARTPDAYKSLARAYLFLCETAIRIDDYDAAKKGVQDALAAAKKGAAPDLAARATARAKQIEDLKGQFEKLKPSRDKLAQDPEDPEANWDVGRFRALVKGHWEGGLPLLAKGANPLLRDQAQKDLANPKLPSEILALADGWWEVAEKEVASRDFLQERAAHWYEKLRLGGAGAEKARVDQRLSEFHSARLSRGTWVDISDPRNFGVPGKAGDRITRNSKERLHMKTLPKGEFDALSLRVKPLSNEGPLLAIYDYDEGMTATLDCRGPNVSATKLVASTQKPLARSDVPKRDEYVFTIVFKEKHMILHVDGREWVRVESLHERVPVVSIYTFGGPVAYDQIKLRKKE